MHCCCVFVEHCTMSSRPCPTILGDCIGVDSPITGLSSQASDQVWYYADCSPYSDAFAPPPLGGGIVTQKCEYTVVVGATQAEADALAAAACGPQAHPTPTTPIYYNTAQTAQVPCLAPDYLTDDQGNHITDSEGNPIILGYSDAGWTATGTVPAGTFSSTTSQDAADAQALALALQIATDKAAAYNCDQSPQTVLTGAGGDQVIGAGGEPVEPVSW